MEGLLKEAEGAIEGAAESLLQEVAGGGAGKVEAVVELVDENPIGKIVEAVHRLDLAIHDTGSDPNLVSGLELLKEALGAITSAFVKVVE